MADPDPDLDPTLFFSSFQDASKKLVFFLSFLLTGITYYPRYIYIRFKNKSYKEVTTAKL
jgi:hypothetical protein